MLSNEPNFDVDIKRPHSVYQCDLLLHRLALYNTREFIYEIISAIISLLLQCFAKMPLSYVCVKSQDMQDFYLIPCY